MLHLPGAARQSPPRCRGQTPRNDQYDALGELYPTAVPCTQPPSRSCFSRRSSYTSSERLDVRLAVSACLDPKTGKTSEWRLVTNLPEAHLRRAPALYAYRMSPEASTGTANGATSSRGSPSRTWPACEGLLERLIFMPDLFTASSSWSPKTERETRALALQAALGAFPGNLCARTAPSGRLGCSANYSTSLCYRPVPARLAKNWGTARRVLQSRSPRAQQLLARLEGQPLPVYTTVVSAHENVKGLAGRGEQGQRDVPTT